MIFVLYDRQRGGFFPVHCELETFKTLDEVRELLLAYHSELEELEELKTLNTRDLAEALNWEIQELNMSQINCNIA
jgi:hypothetical protein